MEQERLKKNQKNNQLLTTDFTSAAHVLLYHRTGVSFVYTQQCGGRKEHAPGISVLAHAYGKTNGTRETASLLSLAGWGEVKVGHGRKECRVSVCQESVGVAASPPLARLARLAAFSCCRLSRVTLAVYSGGFWSSCRGRVVSGFRLFIVDKPVPRSVQQHY